MPSPGRDLFLSPSQSTVEIPSPLHIIKQNEAKKPYIEGPRKTSNISVDTGPERPLTVRKKRKNQGGTRNKENWKDGYDEYQVESSVLPNKHDDIPTNTALDSDKLFAPLTPKANYQSRSSDVPIRATLSPSRLTGLCSSFKERERESSAKTTRRYILRDPSQSSDELSSASFDTWTTNPWDRSPNSSSLGLPFSVGGSATSLSQPSDSISTFPASDCSIRDPYLLVPRISVTPEVRELDNGRSSMWAAIEVSGQLYCPQNYSSANQATNSNVNGTCYMPVNHGGAGLSRYGYLYDMKVDVLPTAQTSIIDLVDDNDAPRIIGPGSSLLLLAYIYIGMSRHSQPHKSLQHESNDIMADLEYQLGSVEIEYLQVRVRYRHSWFPSFQESSFDDNISSCQTKLESTAIGVIKRQNSIAAQSPRLSSASNPISSIIASHWGPARAKEMMRKVKLQRETSSRQERKLGATHASRNISRGGSDAGTEIREKAGIEFSTPRPQTAVGSRHGRPVHVPRRQASLQKRISLPAVRYDEDPDIDPARKIWTKMRRTSSGVDHPAFHVSKTDYSPASTTKSVVSQHKAATVTARSAAPMLLDPELGTVGAERRRDRIRDTTVLDRRSIGAEGLKSLMPSLSLSMTSTSTTSSCRSDRERGKEEERDSFDNRPLRSPRRGADTYGKRDVKPQQHQQKILEGSRKRGDGGRWSLGGWW
ncbi:hypothetical protein F4810DRAFT_464649 [Camillea tinctor]|nr:hypothetical protein F4810DRAFT_464649 [Camillea tinctor]